MKTQTLLNSLAITLMAMAMNACVDPDADVKKNVAADNADTYWVGATGKTDCATKLGKVYRITTVDSLTWSSSKGVICLCGDIRVPSGKTLNIAAGTLIRAFKGTGATLMIMPGGKINAIGISANPIVFTSSAAVGKRAPSDWGGVLILGNARLNDPRAPLTLEEFGPGISPKYGSLSPANNTESSGTLQYVRIEMAGNTTVPNALQNGLTLAGVGSGTTIDHVMVSSSAGDGFQWFGGTVNAKYLISHKNVDDDFDTDLGYIGKVQFGVASRDPLRADAYSGAIGIAAHSDIYNLYQAVYNTAPVFSNFTLIGPMQCSNAGIAYGYIDGVLVRGHSDLKLYNSIIVGWPRYQGYADATIETSPGAYITAVAPPIEVSGDIFNPAALWMTGTSNTAARTTSDACGISYNPNSIYRLSGLQTSAWTLNSVNFTPLTGVGYTSPVLATGTNANAINAFFTENTTSALATATYFRGARRAGGSDDNGWNLSSGWVNWLPETAPYTNDGVYDPYP